MFQQQLKAILGRDAKAKPFKQTPRRIEILNVNRYRLAGGGSLGEHFIEHARADPLLSTRRRYGDVENMNFRTLADQINPPHRLPVPQDDGMLRGGMRLAIA